MSEQEKSLKQIAIDARNNASAKDLDDVWQAVAEAVAARVRAETIEECARFVESGAFLHGDSPAFRFAKECALEMRRAVSKGATS